MYRPLQRHFLLVFGLITVHCDQRHGGCTQEGIQLTCQRLPTHLFSHLVQNVYIEGINIQTDMVTFNPIAWFNVTKLEIQAEGGYIIGNSIGPFQGLSNLESLGIHARRLNYFHTETFLGLSHLKRLDLSYCYRLTVKEVIKSLADFTILPTLDYLDLTAISNSYFRSFSLSSRFFEVLSQRPIKYLNVSHISVTEINFKSATQLCNSLQILNLSNLVYIPKLGTFSRNETSFTCQSVQVLDWSHFSIGNILYDWLTDRNRSHSLVEVIWDFGIVAPSIHTVILNNVNFGIPDFWMRLNGDKYSFSESNFGNIKTLSVKGNKLKWLNASAINVDNITVTAIDLSDNDLEFLSPALLGGLVYLEVLVFRNNMLHVMQQYPDFEDLLATFKNLQTVDLSENDLTFIPTNMFVENKKLRVINLSGNRLESISFSVDELDKLQTLDLRTNHIALLSGAEFEHFSYFVQIRFANYSNFNIDINDNPFVCSCESSQFIRWLYIYLIPKLTKRNQYMCVFKGELVELDETAIAESQDLCLRRSVIICTSVLSCVSCLAVLVLFLLLIRHYRRKKREKLRGEFTERIRKENFDNKCLVFIMFCQKDAEFVSQHVTRPIAACLKQLLMTDCDIIWDFNTYRLGLTLISEAERCLRQSFVVVLLISRAFFKCRRCNRELKLALDKDKPIAVIYKETIGNEEVPPLLQTVAKNSLTGSFIQRQNDLVLKPTIPRFCKSVLDLAATSDNLQDTNI